MLSKKKQPLTLELIIELGFEKIYNNNHKNETCFVGVSSVYPIPIFIWFNEDKKIFYFRSYSPFQKEMNHEIKSFEQICSLVNGLTGQSL